MKQAWHILKKDVRHHWIEIACAVLALVAYAWYAPTEWKTGAFHELESWMLWLIVPLWFISWWILTARLMHDEPFAGDRQFWVTRPYRWTSLLWAKAVLVFLALGALYLALQYYLLLKAGLSPWPHTGELAWRALCFALLALLPAAALASVVANLAQFALGVGIVVAYFIGLTFLSDLNVFRTWTQWNPSSFGSYVCIAIAICISIAVVGVQFSRRRTSLSRWLLAGGLTTIALVLLAIPGAPFVTRQYPTVVGIQQLPWTPGFYPLHPPRRNDYPDRQVVDLAFPLQAELPDDTLAIVAGAHYTLQPNGGKAWSSNWLRGGALMLLPPATQGQINVEVPEIVFERMKATPIAVRIELALDVYRTTDRRRALVSSEPFEFPGIGTCKLTNVGANELDCRAALQTEGIVLASTTLADSSCVPGRESHPEFLHDLRRSIRLQKDADPLDPVVPLQFSFRFADYGPAEHGPVPRILCPGTPVNVVLPHLSNRLRTKISLQLPGLEQIEPMRVAQER